MKHFTLVAPLLISTLLALSFSSCGDADKNQETNKKTGGLLGPASPTPAAGPGSTPNNAALPAAGAIEPSLARVAGLWSMDCQKIADDQSMKGSLFFGSDQQNRVSASRTFYRDSNCATEAYTLAMVFNVKDDGTATDTTADLLPKMVLAEVTFTDAAFIEWANTNKYCDKTNWTSAQKQNVTGLTCNGHTFSSAPDHRITVMGNTNGTLSVKTPDDEAYYDYHK